MARGFLDKFLVFMGIQEEPVEPATPEPVPERVGALRADGGAAHGQGTAQGEAAAARETVMPTEVTVLRPRVFDDVQLAAGFLKGNRPVVVSLKDCERALAQRMLDFLSGATFALDGHMRRLGEDIFMFTPSHITIGEGDEDGEGADGAENGRGGGDAKGSASNDGPREERGAAGSGGDLSR